MSGRKILLMSAVLGLTFGGPAFAEEGLGVGTQYAGNVVSTSLDPLATGTAIANQWVSGDCNFMGVTRGSGIQYTFGGHAVASSRDTKQPQYTELECTITSLRGPSDPLPDQSVTVNLGFGGPVSVVPPTETPVWPLRGVKICISGRAIFGPVDPVEVQIPPSCKSTALLP